MPLFFYVLKWVLIANSFIQKEVQHRMLTVITGSMFSEKSTELQRRGNRLKRAGKNVIYIKPDIDNRYSESEIVTHDNKRVPSYNLPIDRPSLLFTMIDQNTDVVLIDEIQFFDDEIVSVIDVLINSRERRCDVIVAGLDMDFEGKPFATTINLMGIAEEIVKLHAVCSDCGQDAWVSNRVSGGENRVLLGVDEYTPLCRECFNKTKQLLN